MAGAFANTTELDEHGFTYDVICKLIRRLLEHFNEKYPHLAPLIGKLKCLLPKLHIHAHQEMCQVVYALAYAAGFGLIYGEGIETPWTALNCAGLATCEMMGGARRDALNG